MTAGARPVLFGLGLVLALAANGLLGGVSQLGSVHSPGQRVQTYAPVVVGGASVTLGVISGAASAAIALGIAWLLSAGATRTARAANSDC
jgi:hypothetical protein